MAAVAEGDSVFRMARMIEAAFDDREIAVASTPNPRSPLRSSAGHLNGLSLARASSRGKHLILEFTDGLVLHAHMGMSGGWYVYRRGDKWKRPQKSAWLILNLGELDVVQFGGPTLRLVSRANLERDQRLSRLGPDLLDPDTGGRSPGPGGRRPDGAWRSVA